MQVQHGAQAEEGLVLLWFVKGRRSPNAGAAGNPARVPRAATSAVPAGREQARRKAEALGLEPQRAVPIDDRERRRPLLR